MVRASAGSIPVALPRIDKHPLAAYEVRTLPLARDIDAPLVTHHSNKQDGDVGAEIAAAAVGRPNTRVLSPAATCMSSLGTRSADRGGLSAPTIWRMCRYVGAFFVSG
ncbi:MAG: hypothetical protein NVS1B9_11850 [Solirubrobacteraceae bacterium]